MLSRQPSGGRMRSILFRRTHSGNKQISISLQEGSDKKITRELQGEDLRQTINGSLQNLGVISAFMCALAGFIYVEPIWDPECHGNSALNAMFWLLWLSMGMFFLSISTTFILANDLNAFPNNLLLIQLQKMEWWYALPGMLTSCGIFLLAAAYGIDIDLRTSCELSVLGVVLGPLFPLFVIFIAWYLRRKRRQVNEIAHKLGHRKDMEFGTVWYTTWRERCFVNSSEGSERNLLDTLCPHCSPFPSTDSNKSSNKAMLSIDQDPLHQFGYSND